MIPAFTTRSRHVLLAMAVASLVACNSPQDPASADFELDIVASGFANPVYLTTPAGDARLFVVEKGGRVKIVRDGATLPTPFLDISSRVSTGSEQGLLSIAFHPSYATNGYFYVDFTDVNGDTRIERYHVSSNADVADAASSSLVLTVAQPFDNHNGGLLLFGADGKLYVGLGDGGGGGDPQGNGQKLSTLLGKLLRIDVDAGQPYAIPPDNPFVGQTDARGEIWAYGLRNPWRFAFDREAHVLFIADVGQNAREEINAVPSTAKGLNFGWNITEGSACYNASSCATAGFTAPIAEYGHTEGCSITGGFVYRGSALPALQGAYFYSDFCSAFLRSLRWNGRRVADQRLWPSALSGVTSFGEDAEHELYILTADGDVYKLVPRSAEL